MAKQIRDVRVHEEKMPIINCDYCKKDMLRPVCRINAYKNHFCNFECKSRFHSTAMTGKNNPRWNGGNSCGYISKKSEEAVGHRDFCEVCGITKEELGKRIYVHHIDENRNNNKKENLIVVCPSCHAKIHNRAERLNGNKVRI